MMFYLERPRVLVVDDEPSICKVLKLTLERYGYEVVTAGTGEEAEARFQTEEFDLMIMDLRLRESRGDRLFYHAIGCQPHLEKQTLFLTGEVTDRGLDLIRATGCPFLMKPYNADELLMLLYTLYPRVREASA